LAVAVEAVPLLTVPDETEVSITPIEATGGRLTEATLLVLVTPVFSAHRLVAAVSPETRVEVPGETDRNVPYAVPE
jgi:hypothetical protein